MKLIRRSTQWIAAAVIGVCLVAGAVAVAQRQAQSTLPTANNAYELSSIFREVSKNAIPSIVSIETLGTVRTGQGDLQPPFDENSPFGDLFRDDPRLREFFRNRPQPQPRRTQGMGSGFIIDPSGIILTNNHVVQNADRVTVRLHDGREFIATDIKTDPQTDVAIIRIESDEPLQAIPLGNSDNIEIGDWVLAVGTPFGLDLTVTAGIISAKARGPLMAERGDFLQTDAAINPGNSGGPLLNLRGEVIGINTAISTRTGTSSGVGFAIPINIADWVSDQLVESGRVQRAYLGVKIQPVDFDQAQRFETNVGEGVLVREVLADSPAEKAGLQPGDVILEFNGQSVRGTAMLQRIVERLDLDKSYKMLILRDGEQKTLSVSVEQLPEEDTLADANESDEDRGVDPENVIDDLGIEIKPLTPQVARQLGLPDATGVLVASVRPSGLAWRAGLRSGNVIQKIGSTRVNSPDELREALKDMSLEEGILIVVQDKQGTRFLIVQQSE